MSQESQETIAIRTTRVHVVKSPEVAYVEAHRQAIGIAVEQGWDRLYLVPSPGGWEVHALDDCGVNLVSAPVLCRRNFAVVDSRQAEPRPFSITVLGGSSIQ